MQLAGSVLTGIFAGFSTWLVSALIFTFLIAWNEFMVAWILATRAEVQTVTLAVVGLATTLRHHIDGSPGSASVVDPR